MKSIRVTSKLNFHELFTPTFKYLLDCQWIVGPDAFEYPVEWDELCGYDPEKNEYTKGPAADFDRDFRYIYEGDPEGAHTSHGYYSSVDIFPKYSRAIKEDWNDIFAFKKLKDSPLDWNKKVYSLREQHVASTAYCHFMNVDAAFWQFSTCGCRVLMH